MLELNNFEDTGRTFHIYLNPEKDMPPEVQKIHGITNAFLKDKPLFRDVYQEFLDFIGDSTIVAHNARFDIGFLNAELGRNNAPKLTNKVVDTLSTARKAFPGSPANLNALAKRFGVSLHERTVHGALIDAKILSKVYIALCQPKQSSLFNTNVPKVIKKAAKNDFKITVSEEEIQLNKNVLQELQKS